MTPEMIDLARRAVACKGFRWMPGMLDENRNRVLSVAYTSPHYASVSCAGGPVWPHYPLNLLPDFDDPATMGCLLALVREAWGEPWTAVIPMSGHKWGVAIPNVLRESPRFKGPTEAHALVAALEAAPKEKKA